MKQLLCALSLSALVMNLPAMAADAPEKEANGFYAGVATGRLDFDFNDASFRAPSGAIVSGRSLDVDVDSKPPLRVSAGYNWGGWAFEAAYEHMLGSADMELGNTRLDFDYSNFTVGGVYRGAGTLYFLGKAGFSMPDLESNTTGTRLKMSNSGYVGAGVGYRFAPSWSLEFDYTHTNDDTGAFMLGLRKKF